MKAKNLYSKKGLVVVVGILTIMLVVGALQLAATKDIYCNCNKKRFETPGECLRDCRGSRLKCTGCFLSPRCAALQNNKNLKLLYNQALFRKGRVPQNRAQRSLVAHIINRYYKPFSAAQINIILIAGDARSFWAEIEPASTGGKPTLKVHEDLLWTSPAFLISSIGHEMIHHLQSLRQTKVDLTGIDKAIWAFKELEASSWENGETNFNWRIGPNQVFNCLRQVEKDSALKTLQDRRKEVKKRIEELVSWDPRKRIQRLEKWLQQNPWTREVWLPENPNWKSS